MKRALAATLAAASLGGAIWLHSPTSTPSTVPVASPEECLEQLFDAAAAGNVSDYLACFAGAERLRLERELAETDREAFAKSLIQATRSLKGLALNPIDVDGAADTPAMVVERVYEHHLEKQVFEFAQQDGHWRIVSILPAEQRQPLIPYGTPVVQLPSEEATRNP